MTLFRKTQNGCYIAHNATITADVVAGELSSFWFNVVVRGDVAPIRIGRRVNVQDGAIIHCDSDLANNIEDDVTIGHGAIVHGVFVGQGSLIGMGARLLGRTRIGRQCIVAAGSVVPPGLEAPDRSVVMGLPGKVVRDVRPDELDHMRTLVERYVNLAEKYARGEFGPVI